MVFAIIIARPPGVAYALAPRRGFSRRPQCVWQISVRKTMRRDESRRARTIRHTGSLQLRYEPSRYHPGIAAAGWRSDASSDDPVARADGTARRKPQPGRGTGARSATRKESGGPHDARQAPRLLLVSVDATRRGGGESGPAQA